MKKAEWQEIEYVDDVVGSKTVFHCCKTVTCLDVSCLRYSEKDNWNFCPHCGASGLTERKRENIDTVINEGPCGF